MTDTDFAVKANPTPIHRYFPVDTKTKKPLIADWQVKATSNPTIYEKWPSRGELMGVGGEFVIDLDNKEDKNGSKEWQALQDLNGNVVDTHTVKTQNGGFHLRFLVPPGVTIHNSAGKLGEGIDVRGSGGYVVVPPTPGYTLVQDIPSVDPPRWLVDLILEKTESRFELPEVIPLGARNDTLFRYSCQLWRLGYTRVEVRAEVERVNVERTS